MNELGQKIKRIALVLAIVAGLFDAFALLGVLMIEFPLPLLCGLGAVLLSLASGIFAFVYLLQTRAKSLAAWLVLTAAFVTGITGLQMMGWAVNAINAV